MLSRFHVPASVSRRSPDPLRVAGAVLSATSVLLIVAATLITFVFFPRAARLPLGAGPVRTFTGTAAVVTNPLTLTRSHDVPVVARETTAVTGRGNRAVVAEQTTLATTSGTPIATRGHSWAVTRSTAYGAPVRAGDPAGTVNPGGVTVAWPAANSCVTYAVWIAPSATNVNASCARTEGHDGTQARVFIAQVSDRPLTDPRELSLLPSSVPASFLETLVRDDPTQLATLKSAEASHVIASTVKLSYTYAASITWWVDPLTGTIIDQREREVRSASVVTGLGLIPIGAVLDTTLAMTAPSTASAVALARHEGRTLGVLGHDTTDPMVLVGYVLMIIGTPMQFAAWRRRRRRPAHRTPRPDAALAVTVVAPYTERVLTESSA